MPREAVLGHFGGRLHQFHAQGAARGRYMAAFHSVAPRVNCTGRCFWAIFGAGPLHAWGRLEFRPDEILVLAKLQNFGSDKIFGPDEILVRTKFWFEKNSGQEKILVRTKNRTKILVRQKFRPRKNFGPNKIENSGQDKILVRTKIWR